MRKSGMRGQIRAVRVRSPVGQDLVVMVQGVVAFIGLLGIIFVKAAKAANAAHDHFLLSLIFIFRKTSFEDVFGFKRSFYAEKTGMLLFSCTDIV